MELCSTPHVSHNTIDAICWSIFNMRNIISVLISVLKGCVKFPFFSVSQWQLQLSQGFIKSPSCENIIFYVVYLHCFQKILMFLAESTTHDCMSSLKFNWKGLPIKGEFSCEIIDFSKSFLMLALLFVKRWGLCFSHEAHINWHACAMCPEMFNFMGFGHLMKC